MGTLEETAEGEEEGCHFCRLVCLLFWMKSWYLSQCGASSVYEALFDSIAC